MTFVGHTGEIKAVAVSPDGRWALSGAVDQTLKLWSLTGIPTSGSTTRGPVLTLFPATHGEWIAWTPEGYFAASDQGAHLIGYSLNRGFAQTAAYISVDQLYKPLLPTRSRPSQIAGRFHAAVKAGGQTRGA